MYVVGNGGDGAAGDSSTGGGGDRRKQGCVPRVWEGSPYLSSSAKGFKEKEKRKRPTKSKRGKRFV